jgi:hypothetical protein
MGFNKKKIIMQASLKQLYYGCISKFHTKTILQLQERENHTSHQTRHSVITYLIAVPSNAHQEVVRLNISVDETFAVHILYTTNHLIGQHKDCLNSKST